jgi:hypothetical protein
MEKKKMEKISKGMVQKTCYKCKKNVAINEDDLELFLEYYDESDIICADCKKDDNVFTIIEKIKDDEAINNDDDTEDAKE